MIGRISPLLCGELSCYFSRWSCLGINRVCWLSQLALSIVWTGLLRWFTGKESACNAEDQDSIPRSVRSAGGGHGNPLQYLAWSIPWTEESGRLQSMGSQRVGHDWSYLACTHIVNRVSSWFLVSIWVS